MQFSRRWDYSINGKVEAVDIAASTNNIVIGSSEGLVILFDSSGKRQWSLAVYDPIVSAKCNADASRTAILTANGSLMVVDENGTILWNKEKQYAASCLDLRPGSNMILLGNRYRQFRNISIHGKVISQGEVPHPVDYVRFAPGGKKCALACADGHVTLLGYKGDKLWTSFLHRMILGIAVAEKADVIIAPSRERGIVALDINGAGSGVYEMRDPIVDAKINDTGELLFALDIDGNLIQAKKNATVLSRQSVGFAAERLSVDCSGHVVVVSGMVEPRKSIVAFLRSSDKDTDRIEFIELSSGDTQEHDDKVTSTDYLELD